MYKYVYITSGSVDNRVTSGGASFLVKVVTKSESVGNISISFINTLIADKTTAAFACANLGVILSHILKCIKQTNYDIHCSKLIKTSIKTSLKKHKT